MNKAKLLMVFLFSIFTFVNAQKNIGIDYYGIKDYELAKKYFLQKLSENPAEAHYYLGEIAFAEGQLEEAENYYNKGLQTKFDFYCKIGLAKINLKKGQKSEALSSLLSIQKKHSSDIDILVAIGYAYLDNQLYKDVESLLKDMQKVDKKNPKIYVLEGDMFNSMQQNGVAAGKYEMAILFDPNYAPAYIKLAEVYEKSNWQVAIEKLKNLLERHPDYTIAYRYLGKIYTNNMRLSLAIDAFKAFFAAGNYTLDDIGKYAQALFFNKNYDEANEKIKEGLAINPSHFVLNRLQMYVAAHTLNIEAGLNYAKQFFLLKKEQPDEYITLDYSMYALLLKEAKMYDEAIEQYKQVLLKDNTAIESYKEIAILANLKGQSGVAADYYRYYIEKSEPEKIDVMDYFQMGRYYYSASTFRNATDTANLLLRYKDDNFLSTISENELQKDSLLANVQLFIEKALKYYMNQADRAFGKVIELVPDGYTGYMWKGRVNSLMDPNSEMGLAKPYYEKVVEILAEREEKTNIVINSLVEAYSYLGYYYYLKEDKPNITLFWNKVLELDPENTNANAVLKPKK